MTITIRQRIQFEHQISNWVLFQHRSGWRDLVGPAGTGCLAHATPEKVKQVRCFRSWVPSGPKIPSRVRGRAGGAGKSACDVGLSVRTG